MSTRVPALAMLLGLLLLLGGALPVLGHVRLVESDPPAGATVTDVDAVVLVFDEPLDKDASSFKLIGPDGSTVGTGTVRESMRITLDDLTLQPGGYTVKWTAAGTDDHIERGRFSFTVESAVVTAVPSSPGVTRTPGPGDGPAAPAATATLAPASMAAPGTMEVPGAQATPAPVASAVESVAADVVPASTSSTDVVIPIVAGLMIVGVLAFVVLRRSRTA